MKERGEMFSDLEGGREREEGEEGGGGGGYREGVRWDPLHINSLGIDEMIRRGLGRQA